MPAHRGAPTLHKRPHSIRFTRLGQDGGYHQIRVMLGSNRDENKLFLAFDPTYVRCWFGLIPTLRNRDKYEQAAYYGSRMSRAGAADEPAMRMRSEKCAAPAGRDRVR